MRMKRIKKAPRAKTAARLAESKGTVNTAETTRFKWMTSSHAIVLGMIFVVVTAALLTAREDVPQPAVEVEHEELTAMAATVENNATRAFETKKPAAVNKTPAATTPEPPAASMTQAAGPQPESTSVATITGCLENDEGSFQLTDASGAGAPTARSWKSGFIKKRAAHVELVDAVGLNLRQYTGRRVAVTGTLVERDMRARSVRLIGACD